MQVDVKELDVFLGKNFVVTHHDEPVPAIEKAWATITKDPRYTNHGPDRILVHLRVFVPL